MPLSPSIRRGLTLLAACIILNLNAYGQTTPASQELLNSMIKALGGEQFLNVKEIRTSGRFFTFHRDAVATSDLYSDYVKFPDMERTEFGREKEQTVQINNGKKGWTISPGKDEPEVQSQSAAQTQEFLQNFRTSFDYMTRFVVRAHGTSVLKTGSEVIDYKRTDILEVRDPGKNLMRIYIERDNHLPVKTEIRLSNESTVHEEVLANWHEFDGVMTPLMVVRYKDGIKTMEIRTEDVAYNSGLDDSLFAPPESSK